MTKVTDRYQGIADLSHELRKLLMRQAQKLVQQPQLMHEFQSRGVDRVAAEIAKEVGVLLEHDDVDAGTGQEEAEHHAGRTAASDTTTRGKGLGHGIALSLIRQIALFGSLT
jgi:hypothetical protein